MIKLVLFLYVFFAFDMDDADTRSSEAVNVTCKASGG